MTDIVDDILEHHGVKGMKWGVRKAQDIPGVSRKTSREAAKDAAEFTKAKLFYGEGAGVRRRLINNTVKSKSAKDPAYKKAFDHHVANTDLSKRAEQARSARKRKDVSNSTRKTARGIGHIIRGNPQYASLAAASLASGAVYAHKRGYDKMAYNAVKNSQAAKVGAEAISRLLSR